MNKELFVQNVKRLCDLQGIKPTVACKDSGAGKDLINQIENRGSIPSVEKVQMLAAYLGVTTSELLGEEKIPTPVSEGGPNQNTIKIAGRDGSFVERELTDDQVALMKNMLNQLKPIDDENI